MSDHDRLISYGLRTLDDGCDACNHSKVYCRCSMYMDYGPCCDECSHGAT